MKGFQCGAKHPRWRGGRSIASNGYVLVRVGTAHHLADVRGYAYEHRLVAEQKLGRRLRDSEEVHHIDGNKHRRTERLRRIPDEENRLVACECGCGIVFPAFDATGRARRFVSGHNSRRGNGRFQ